MQSILNVAPQHRKCAAKLRKTEVHGTSDRPYDRLCIHGTSKAPRDLVNR
jgi:hypothetical protein